jgi:hypothetical protein
MLKIIPISLAAGGASALLFASVASGSLLSIPLFYLSPLPIIIAGLGWSHFAAFLAALGAALALGLSFNWVFFASFLCGIALPAWWLSYLALLARPSANGSAALEWYPVGRLVLWATILGGVVVALAIITIDSDADAFKSSLRRTLERLVRVQGQGGGASTPDLRLGERGATFLDLMVAVLPPAAAVLTSLTNVFALWLAGRIVKISGRLSRDWPHIAGMTFPKSTLPAFAILLAGTFLPGIMGIVATVLSASMLIAFSLLGLAAAHVLTRQIGSRTFILWAVYGAIAVFGWPILLMSALGLAETTFDLRNRAAGGSPPANPPTIRS